MPPNRNVALRKKIATFLTQETGTASGEALHETAVRVCGRLAQQLAPLIGDEGVAALATRSLHLTQREFPCLADLRNPTHPQGPPLAELGAVLARQESEVARDAAAALLATFTELLETLIGEGLTARMLIGAWSDRAPDGTPRKWGT
jgi:hypothetical protein